MRVAALYDIHGNLPALEAVLAALDRAAVDLVVVGGDVFPGPLAIEALDLLLALERPVRFLRGNGDREVLALAEGAEPDGVPAPYLEPMRWLARRLTTEHRRRIATWPATLRLPVDGLGDVLFCHATPTSDSEIFTRRTPKERLRELFAAPGAPLVVCGHTHMPFDLALPTARVVNAGSVGMPFGDDAAHWLLLGAEVAPQRTAYDLDAAAALIRASGYPQADDFAARSVLHPPGEEEMLEIFARAEP